MPEIVVVLLIGLTIVVGLLFLWYVLDDLEGKR